MILDYFNLALKSLKHRGLRTWLTIIGILIGIFAVVSLMTVGAGLKAAVNSQFDIGSTQVLTVEAGGLSSFGPPGSGAVTPLTRQDAEAIEQLGRVEVAIARSIETVKLEFDDKLVIGFAASLPDDKEQRDIVYDLLDVEVASGRLVDDTSRKVVLGNNFASADSSGFDEALEVGDTLLINNVSFEVEGILKKKGSFIVDTSLLVPDSQLEDISGYGDEVDLIAVLVKDQNEMDIAKEDVEELMRDRRDVKVGEEDFEVSTPDAQLSTVNDILFGIQAFIIIVALISIAVGAIGIVNTMTTSVIERRKEIGIMKSIGARNSDIFLQFFIEAGLLGLIGGLLGTLLGTGVGYAGVLAINQFIGAEATPTINFALIFLTLTVSFLIGALSGTIPAIQAAKLNPVRAIRGI